LGRFGAGAAAAITKTRSLLRRRRDENSRRNYGQQVRGRRPRSNKRLQSPSESIGWTVETIQLSHWKVCGLLRQIWGIQWPMLQVWWLLLPAGKISVQLWRPMWRIRRIVGSHRLQRTWIEWAT
jgi:hypothetical protein